MNENVKDEIKQAEEEVNRLHEFVMQKYFSKVESDRNSVKIWFEETTVKFFELYSFEWFHQVTYKSKKSTKELPSLKEALNEVLANSKGIIEEDKEWLKKQYNKFIDSEGNEENLLFWYYGISMFSSRLITARNYADELSVNIFKDSKFILDTNILMILDLEGHELSNSLKALEKLFQQLNIIPVYLNITRDEYLRAMNFRKDETIRVFNNYNLPVLYASDCPFILTALKRGCRTEDDLQIFFDQLLDIPKFFHQTVPLIREEYAELDEVIGHGRRDEELKEKINEVYKKRHRG